MKIPVVEAVHIQVLRERHMEVPEDHFKSKDPGFCLIKIISKSRDFSHITGNYSVMFL